MPRYIGKVNGQYFEYSTVVDAPVSKLMNLDEFRAYYQEEYGTQHLMQLQQRIDRADAKGTSSLINASFEEMISCNRYGEQHAELSVKDFIVRLKKESALVESNYL